MEEKKEEPREASSMLQSRRQLLGKMAGLMGAVCVLEFMYPLLKLVTPIQRGEAEPVMVPLEDVPVGSAKQIIYDGSPSIVLNHKEGIIALSLVCTHLGCIVKWDEQQQNFQCPCHEGFFDKTGKVISGPPPAPLEQLTVKITGNKLIIGIG